MTTAGDTAVRSADDPARPDGRSVTSRHLSWVSTARLVAIAAVVAIHVFGHLVAGYGDQPQLAWHPANLIDSASRFAVPLFVLVSGAMLLRPPARPEPVREFFARRAARIAIPLVVWTAFFLWFDRLFTDEPVTPFTFVQGYLWGRPYYHLYFLYVIAGLYLITPFLRVFTRAASRRAVLSAALVCLSLAFADRVQHLLLGGGGGYNAFSFFVPWVGYYLLGYAIGAAPDPPDRTSARRTAIRAGAAYVGAIGLTTVTTWLLFSRFGYQVPRLSGEPFDPLTMTYDYFMPTTMLAAASVAILLKSLGAARSTSADPTGSPRTPWSRRLADLTLGVFLLHPIPLAVVRDAQPEFASPLVDLGFHALLWAGLLVGCALVTALMRRIPAVRRLV